ncbi:gamma-secretase subunit Aph-1b-like [Watersipora subatra]|uniref:gamma-secretase subunit Aph-1b-like n=1 Tax=Watersipora subatra TaxID=2589382 RepID=UPI00355BFD17
MTLVELLGCLLVTFGPPGCMFVVTVARKPLHVILLMASAFFWLLSLMVSSIFYKIPISDQRSKFIMGVVLSVLFQEFFRYLYYYVVSKARVGLEAVHNQGKDKKKPLNMLAVYYSAGLGYGLVSGAFATVNVFRDLAGPGTVGILGDSQFFFIISSFTALAFILLHVSWGVVFMGSLDSELVWRKVSGVVGVVCTHLLVSGLSVLNYRHSGSAPVYGATITVAYIMLIVMTLWAYNIAGGSGRTLKHLVHPPSNNRRNNNASN